MPYPGNLKDRIGPLPGTTTIPRLAKTSYPQYCSLFRDCPFQFREVFPISGLLHNDGRAILEAAFFSLCPEFSRTLLSEGSLIKTYR